MYIQDLVKNKGNSEEECLSVVGDLNGLHAISNIWEQYADLLHIIGINEFIEWGKKEFDHKESAAFQEGLQAFPKFFEKCYKEVKKS